MGEEILFDDPLKHRHNLTVYVCCKHFQAIFGIAAQEVCGRHGHSDDSEPFEKLRSACGDVWDDVDVSKLMDELRPGAKSTE